MIFNYIVMIRMKLYKYVKIKLECKEKHWIGEIKKKKKNEQSNYKYFRCLIGNV